ncbi:scavenger receptor class B member 1-like isoform X2 [Zootermopsis nevadensis]|uniref:scavenger receptor class B member 1-like isoform X2 n=1 Tax=Zootermopsis nevadensis TaxID=136037 RepID=UPI000B8EE04D|nr:scavenger receptor class B member 1-like isoform X2 [Zootermopsis nevadensis]
MRAVYSRPLGAFVLMALGVLSMASACFILLVRPYDLIFRVKVMLSPGGETFELWRKPPVNLYLRIWLFNVTNKEAFMAGKEKLRVQETGPYVYKELMEHYNVTFNDNGTLTTIPRHPLVWEPEMSAGKEDDVLVLPNIALLSIADVVKDTSFFTRMGINLLAGQTKSEGLVTITARDFMFGYKNPLVTLGNKFMPTWIKFDKLGLIDRMYDFDGDFSTVYTGETDVRKSGLIDTYRGSPLLPHWKGEHCSNVRGASDATKFPSLLQPNDTVYFYRKSVCRAMPTRFTNEMKTIMGLQSYRFTFPNNSLDNGEVIPENKCFCRNGKCLPAGLIDVQDCYYGFPIGVSYPHFYQGDPMLVDAVEGSHPDKQKHESHFYIEPKSGLPLDVTVRFQINMVLGDVSGITRAAKFSDMVLPMLWTEFRMSKLPEDLNNRFILYLNVLPVVEKVLMYLLFSTGIMFLLGSISRILLLNRDLQKKSANMDFSSGNSRELKRIHIKNTKANENRPSSDKVKEAEAFYSSLLIAAESDDVPEDNLNSTEMDILAGGASNIITPGSDEGIDNYSCDNTEKPPPQYDLINLALLKEAIV